MLWGSSPIKKNRRLPGTISSIIIISLHPLQLHLEVGARLLLRFRGMAERTIPRCMQLQSPCSTSSSSYPPHTCGVTKPERRTDDSKGDGRKKRHESCLLVLAVVVSCCVALPPLVLFLCPSTLWSGGGGTKTKSSNN